MTARQIVEPLTSRRPALIHKTSKVRAQDQMNVQFLRNARLPRVGIESHAGSLPRTSLGRNSAMPAAPNVPHQIAVTIPKSAKTGRATVAHQGPDCNPFWINSRGQRQGSSTRQNVRRKVRSRLATFTKSTQID
jgi:hypothetical protein